MKRNVAMNRFQPGRSLLLAGLLLVGYPIARIDADEGIASSDRPSVVPTFASDVATILYERCANCHHRDSVAPFPLLSFEDAKERAELIGDVVQRQAMPPWKPTGEPHEFSNDRRLSPVQIDTIVRWVEGGAPAGDLPAAPSPPNFREGWQLGEPDLVLTLPEPFTVPAEGEDVYWHFVFPLPIKTTKYLAAVECRPSNRLVAHHGVGMFDTSGKARQKDSQSPQIGYGGFDQGFLPAGFTPGYAPGQIPGRFMDGVSIPIQPGTDFVLQMHYHPIGREATDQTQVGFYFTDKPPTKSMTLVVMATEAIRIPANEPAFHGEDHFTLPSDFLVCNIWSHMHMIGKRVLVEATLPNGDQRKLLHIDDWDFNWQETYHWAEPFTLPAGTKIHSQWTWDNSASNPRNPHSPPKPILRGEGSTDEMSGLIISGIVPTENDAKRHWIEVGKHFLGVKFRGYLFDQGAKIAEGKD
jgi:hypothetical protein